MAITAVNLDCRSGDHVNVYHFGKQHYRMHRDHIHESSLGSDSRRRRDRLVCHQRVLTKKKEAKGKTKVSLGGFVFSLFRRSKVGRQSSTTELTPVPSKTRLFQNLVTNATNAAILALTLAVVALILVAILYALAYVVGTNGPVGPAGQQGGTGLSGTEPGPVGPPGPSGAPGFPGAQNPPLQQWVNASIFIPSSVSNTLGPVPVSFPIPFTQGIPKVFGVVLSGGYTPTATNFPNAYLQTVSGITENGFSVTYTQTDHVLSEKGWISDSTAGLPLFLYFAYVPQPSSQTPASSTVHEWDGRKPSFWEREFSQVYDLDTRT